MTERTTRIPCCILLAFVLLVACKDTPKPTSTPLPPATATPVGGISRDECEVYNSFLREAFANGDKPVDVFVIYKELFEMGSEGGSLYGLMMEPARQALAEHVDAATWTDFQDKLSRNIQLEDPCFSRSVHRTILVTKEEIGGIFKENPDDGWKEFYQKYSNAPGLLQFSRVGFSPAKDKALVYVGMQWGSLAGQGSLLVLRREGSSWVIDGGTILWLS